MAKDFKIFMFMIVAVFLIGSVSAFEWDNVKRYDEKTKTITVVNALGLGDDIAKIQLNTPLNNIVGYGSYQKVAEFKLSSFSDYSNAFKELELFDKKKGNQKFLRDYDFKYLTYKNVTVNDYKDVCTIETINKTETEVCNQVVSGNHTEQREEWIKLTPADFKKNDVLTIGIFTFVEKGDRVEWIPNFFGVRIDEWAEWTASLNVNLQHYYNFEDTSSKVIDVSNGTENGTISNSPTNVSGIIGSALDFNRATPDWVTFGYRLPSADGTICFWFKPEDTTASYVMGRNGAGGNTGDWDYYPSTASQIYINPASDITGNDTISAGNWYNICLKWGTGGGRLYNNGVLVGVTAGTQAPDRTPDWTIGRDAFQSDQYYEGVLDEIGIWDRRLSDVEIIDIYNGGAGITWTDEFGSDYPTITLNSPVNAYNSTVRDLALNGTGTDNINLESLTLYVNGVLNQTNSSPINNTLTTFFVTFPEGDHTWFIKATDNESQTTNASAFNLSVDTAPVINVFSPLNQSYGTSTIYFNATSSQTVGSWIADYNGTNATITINTTLEVEDGDNFNLKLYANDTNGVFGLNDTIYFTVDTTAPILNDAQNLTDLVVDTLPTNSTWNYTVNDLHVDSCYYNTSENAALTFITCNTSAINTTWATEGNKTIQYYVNDTGGLETRKLAYIYVYYVTYIQTDNLDPVGEGTNVTFDLNVSLTNTSTITATLRLNNTYYNPDTTTATTNYYYFTKIITIPDTYGNTTGYPQLWLWNYTIDGVVTNASTYDTNVTVYKLAIDDCSSFGDPILNISLKDEEANTLVNSSAGSTIEIDLRLTSLSDPTFFIDYNNTWTNINESAVCIPSGLLGNSTYKIDFTIGYQATSKVWEFFYLDGGVLNSTKVFDAYTTSIINLMDLITIDSTSFLFNFFNTDGLPVENSIVHVFRKYIGEGLFREVERGQADENGDTVIHLVEEDVIYYFLITDNGNTIYTSSTYTALCQTTPCTIVLEASGDSAEFPTDYDLLPDGNFTINSSVTTRKISVVYNFDTSTDINFTVYKYDSDGNYSSVSTNNATGTSGIITLAIPLSAGNISFFTAVYVENEFIASEWVDFSDKATDYFGQTLSLFLAGLIILTLSLIAVSEGAGVIVFVIIGVLVSGAFGLISTSLSTGISILTFLILAGGLIVWKLTGGRK